MEEKNNISKHDLKKLRQEERDKAREQQETIKTKARFTKNIVKYGGILVVIVAIIVAVVAFNRNGVDGNAVKEKPYTSSQVHWHASLQVFTCGNYREMPKPVGADDAHLGQPLLHTHKDGLIHIEGRVYRKGDIALGKYMDNIGVKFDSDKILDYVNGDGCKDGKENTVNMKVNGKENSELRDYVIQDGDKIEVRYE